MIGWLQSIAPGSLTGSTPAIVNSWPLESHNSRWQRKDDQSVFKSSDFPDSLGPPTKTRSWKRTPAKGEPSVMLEADRAPAGHVARVFLEDEELQGRRVV